MRQTKNAISTLDQLVQNMTILRYYGSKDTIDIVHIEVAVNYVVYCSVIMRTTIGQPIIEFIQKNKMLWRATK